MNLPASDLSKAAYPGFYFETLFFKFRIIIILFWKISDWWPWADKKLISPFRILIN
jgi:hypothetical protein